MKKQDLLRALLLAAPLIIYMLLAVPALDRPGLHYDEALESGWPAVQLLNGGQPALLNNVGLGVVGRQLPLMVQNHIGAGQIYAALPLIALGGPTATSLRAMGVIAGALTLLATMLLLRRVAGDIAALYGGLWLASCASFIFWMRQGTFVTALAPMFAMLALAIGARWWATRSRRALFLAGLCAGLAIYSKLSALWIFNALLAWGVIMLALRRPTLRGRWRSVAGDGLAALGGLLLGSWPLLLYNLRSGGTLAVVGQNTGRTYLGADNAAILSNLKTRLAQAADVVRSGEHLGHLGGNFPTQIALLVVAAALAVLVIVGLLRRGAGQLPSLLLPLATLLVIAQSCFTISALWHTHFAVVIALPALLVGAALAQLRRWRWAHLAATLLVGAALIGQTWASMRYLEAAVESGGVASHSAAIYELERALHDADRPVIALDWGIAAQLTYLSGGRTQVTEDFTYEHFPDTVPPGLAERLSEEELYLLHAPYQEAFQHRAAFLRAATQRGLLAERIYTAEAADGTPMMEIWQVRQRP